MMAWMTEETLLETLETGRTVFWSRSRQERWRKGDTSGDRQWVRAAYYDCDGDTLLFLVEQEGAGACHTGERQLLLPGLRLRWRQSVNCPSRDEFASLARRYTVVPVWRELLADLTTPVAAFTRLAGEDRDDRAFLLESVEHAERWGRWSFIGRRPSATLIARGRRIDVEGRLPVGVPLDRGVFAAIEGLLSVYRSPVIDELPPLHGGVVGYLGYDTVREVEHLPDVPPDEKHTPTPSCRWWASWPPTTTGASGSP